AGGRLLQEADDLLFGVSLLHVRPLVRRTLLRSGWPGKRGAGHDVEAPFVEARNEIARRNLIKFHRNFGLLRALQGKQCS
ncbi:hypothetical protein, partial [Stenotrophomonas pavanii]